MMETLADAYRRATRAVRAAPTHVERFMLEALAEDAVVSDLLQRNVRESAARVVPSDAELTAIDAAVLRALVAETVVEFRWAVHIGRTDQRLHQLGSEDRDRAIACWAADVIVRRRVEVRALEAEPSAETLADWLEAFSAALGLALARAEMVRAPVMPIEALYDVRAGNYTQRRRVDGVFASAELELARWRFVPPKNHPLTLPFPSTGPNNPNTVLTSALLRTYLTTFQLAEEAGCGDGTFTVDVPHIIGDLWGKPKYREPKRGIHRPHPSDVKTFKRAFETLQRIQIERLGDVKLGDPKLGIQPQWLVSCMEFPKGKVYQHAQIVVHAMRNFLQVPNAVLQLEADDTPLALGVAIMWRRRIGEVLRGPGHYRVKLCKLAEDIGEDTYKKRKKLGARVYFTDLVNDLQRVVRDGALGAVHLEGEGADALVTLTPSDALGTVYSSLAEPRTEPTLTATRTPAELVAQRRPGRPRRDV
jgi:hypothetical protein